MRRSIAIIFTTVAMAALMGCDAADVTQSQWAAPQIRVSFTNPEASSKASTIFQVTLDIKSLGGRDFSPEPVTVDNAATSQVAFDVSLPPDSSYTFTVRFTSSGSLVAEGATLQKVTLETTVIDVAVLKPSASVPSIAFIPSQIATSTGSGNIQVTLRYYGLGQPIAGIAALIDVVGPTPRPFTLTGPDEDAGINFVEGNRLNAAWQFSQDADGFVDIGTLSLSKSQPADFCLEAGENNVRVVDREGSIRSADFLTTCIKVTQ